jgi:hypothetical protein
LPFTSEVELRKQTSLGFAGLDWGLDGQRLVFSQVSKLYVNFKLDYFTRYGTAQSVTLPAGEYRVTGIGVDLNLGLKMEKILDRGAFVNEDVVRFVVAPGKATRLTVETAIHPDQVFIGRLYVPDVRVSVAGDEGTTAPVPVFARTATSIGWGAYTGDLKPAKRR